MMKAILVHYTNFLGDLGSPLLPLICMGTLGCAWCVIAHAVLLLPWLLPQRVDAADEFHHG